MQSKYYLKKKTIPGQRSNPTSNFFFLTRQMDLCKQMKARSGDGKTILMHAAMSGDAMVFTEVVLAHKRTCEPSAVRGQTADGLYGENRRTFCILVMWAALDENLPGVCCHPTLPKTTGQTCFDYFGFLLTPLQPSLVSRPPDNTAEANPPRN